MSGAPISSQQILATNFGRVVGRAINHYGQLGDKATVKRFHDLLNVMRYGLKSSSLKTQRETIEIMCQFLRDQGMDPYSYPEVKVEEPTASPVVETAPVDEASPISSFDVLNEGVSLDPDE